MLSYKKINDVIVVSFVKIDRLNISYAAKIKQEINELFVEKKSKVILDFKNVNFIDSSGFATLISNLKTSRKSNSKFILCNINKEVMELVKLMQLHNIFDIKEDVNSALDAI